MASERAFRIAGTDSYSLWHQRLGHPSRQSLSLFSKISTDSLKNNVNHFCDICHRAKQTRAQFPLSNSKASSCFELIHYDIWGRYSTSTFCGSYYFLTIVNDFSRATWIFLMKEKGETAKLLIGFCAMVRNQFGHNVKTIRSDNGLEFTSKTLLSYYFENGIIHQTSCVDTPQQNGRVERKHRHILNVARALRFQANLPIQFWGECAMATTYLINLTPTPLLNGKTPYEILFQRLPPYSHIRIFGCLCYAHQRPN